MKSPQISAALRNRVREAAHHRCGYCLSLQRYVMGTLEVEHLVPRAKGGKDAEDNLRLSCSLCNRYKGTQTSAIDALTGTDAPLFNPRHDKWSEHFQWSADGVRIIGLTPTGRATVEALKLNNELAVEVRRNWSVAGWHPPEIEE
jgi:hypothetical protein